MRHCHIMSGSVSCEGIWRVDCAGVGTSVLGVLVVASVLMAFVSPGGASADRSRAKQKGIGAWQQAIARLPVPSRGCFTGSYPAIQWRKARCNAVPNYPDGPAQGTSPQTVGNGTDYSAEVSGSMSSAEGSFDSIELATSETGIVPGSCDDSYKVPLDPKCKSGPNIYSLQLNTKPFTTPMCSGGARCRGWQQFIYSSTFNTIFIQYWLLGYSTVSPSCPGGWNIYPKNATANFSCFVDGINKSRLPGGPLKVETTLSAARLTGTATAGDDTVVLTSGSGQATADSMASMLNLATHWKGVEFTIVGDFWGSAATFSPTTLFVRATTHNGTKLAPSCVLEGFTGETNNLNLVNTPAIVTGASPGIVSQQTDIIDDTPGCAATDGLGDTHLKTFRNLFYDFQASGDFELATTGPDFTVQTRQVSGAPTWPDAAINQAVATQIGTSEIAVCTAPTRLEINNTTVDIPDGVPRDLPDGGDVTRRGNVYSIRSKNGDSVRAQVNPGNPAWINASVGLGRWPATVHGLLANAGTNVNAIASSGGTVLTAPFAFNDFYHLYAESCARPRGPVIALRLRHCRCKRHSQSAALRGQSQPRRSRRPRRRPAGAPA